MFSFVFLLLILLLSQLLPKISFELVAFTLGMHLVRCMGLFGYTEWVGNNMRPKSYVFRWNHPETEMTSLNETKHLALVMDWSWNLMQLYLVQYTIYTKGACCIHFHCWCSKHGKAWQSHSLIVDFIVDKSLYDIYMLICFLTLSFSSAADALV